MKIFTICFAIVVLLIQQTNAQTPQADRDWWNGLGPAWKKILQNQELKGKNVDPTPEQLNRIVKIKQIDCSNNNEVESLKALAKLELLEVIRCNNSPGIKSLEGIESLKNLKEIDCSDNDNINSLIPLQGLTNLEKINCGNTMIKDLKPLSNLTKLRILDAHFSTVSELIFISSLTNLEKLDVSKNQSLFSLQGIEKLSKLTDLNCAETKVIDLIPLATCGNMEILDISGTPVNTLRSLQNLRKIRELNFSDTRIRGSSLDYLYSMASMEMLRGKNIDVTAPEKEVFEGNFKKKSPNCTILISPIEIK